MKRGIRYGVTCGARAAAGLFGLGATPRHRASRAGLRRAGAVHRLEWRQEQRTYVEISPPRQFEIPRERRCIAVVLDEERWSAWSRRVIASQNSPSLGTRQGDGTPRRLAVEMRFFGEIGCWEPSSIPAAFRRPTASQHLRCRALEPGTRLIRVLPSARAHLPAPCSRGRCGATRREQESQGGDAALQGQGAVAIVRVEPVVAERTTAAAPRMVRVRRADMKKTVFCWEWSPCRRAGGNGASRGRRRAPEPATGTEDGGRLHVARRTTRPFMATPDYTVRPMIYSSTMSQRRPPPSGDRDRVKSERIASRKLCPASEK